MICDLAVRRTRTEGTDVYTLRVTGKTALGPSGTGGRDGKDFTSAADLIHTLQNLGAPEESIARAEVAMTDPTRHDRFTDVAKGLQIQFQALEQADIYLFDQS